MAAPRSHSGDPRAERLRAQLRRAAYDLLEERPADTISVTDIVQRAGVSRAAFYQHFTDRDDAIAAAVVGLVDEALSGADGQPLDAIERMAGLVAERHRLYSHLFPGAAAERARWHLRQHLRPHCRALVEGGQAAELDVETLASALVGAIVELLLAWVDDPSSARRPAEVRAAVLGLTRRLNPSSGAS